MTTPSPEPDENTLPDRGQDDRDLGWGERPDAERDDDERFLQERPPHWE